MIFCSPRLPHADNFPLFPVKDLCQRAVEKLAIGSGHVEPERVVAPRHDLASHLEARSASEGIEQVPIAVSHRPDGIHHWRILPQTLTRCDEIVGMIVHCNARLCGAAI